MVAPVLRLMKAPLLLSVLGLAQERRMAPQEVLRLHYHWNRRPVLFLSPSMYYQNVEVLESQIKYRRQVPQLLRLWRDPTKASAAFESAQIHLPQFQSLAAFEFL